MKHYYKNALYIIVGLIPSILGYFIQFEMPIISLLLYLISTFIILGTFFEGISDSVKDGIERANKKK